MTIFERIRERRIERDEAYAQWGAPTILLAVACVFGITVGLSALINGQPDFRAAGSVAILTFAIVVGARFRMRA